MSFFKGIDFFKKESHEISKQTVIGAVISSLAIFSITFLLGLNIYEYLFPNLKREPIIYHDPNNSPTRFFLILVVDAPCSIISLYTEDSVGYRMIEVERAFRKINLGSDYTYLGQHTTVPATVDSDEIAKALETKNKCHLRGDFQILPVQAKLVITIGGNESTKAFFRLNYPELYNKLALKHRISYIKFEEVEDSPHLLNIFGKNDHTKLRTDEFPDYHNSNRNTFDYFLKLTPNLFIDSGILGENHILVYDYSINSQERNVNLIGNSAFPEITINYDFSYVTMKITKNNKGFPHLLTHICAIIGGVFVVFNILNRILNLLFDKN